MCPRSGHSNVVLPTVSVLAALHPPPPCLPPSPPLVVIGFGGSEMQTPERALC